MEKIIQIFIHKLMTMIQMMIMEKMVQMIITEVTETMSMVTERRIFKKMMIFMWIAKKRKLIMIIKKKMKVKIIWTEKNGGR